MQGYCQEKLAFHHKTLTTPYFQAPIFNPFFVTAYFKKRLTQLAVMIGSLSKGAFEQRTSSGSVEPLLWSIYFP